MTVAPGWYPDPSAPEQQRYHDGARWTEHVAPMVATSAGAPQWTAPLAPRSGKATASLILSIIWVFGLGSIAAIILGVQARKEIRTGEKSGSGSATAGIVIGIFGIVGALLVAAIFMFVRDTFVDFESGLTLFTVQQAQVVHHDRNGTYASTVDELAQTGAGFSRDTIFPGVVLDIVSASDDAFCAEARDAGEVFHILRSGGVERGGCPAV